MKVLLVFRRLLASCSSARYGLSLCPSRSCSSLRVQTATSSRTGPSPLMWTGYFCCRSCSCTGRSPRGRRACGPREAGPLLHDACLQGALPSSCVRLLLLLVVPSNRRAWKRPETLSGPRPGACRLVPAAVGCSERRRRPSSPVPEPRRPRGGAGRIRPSRTRDRVDSSGRSLVGVRRLPGVVGLVAAVVRRHPALPAPDAAVSGAGGPARRDGRALLRDLYAVINRLGITLLAESASARACSSSPRF